MQPIPKTMRAAAIDRFGGPEVLSLHSLPVPVPETGEVLIAIDTAGVGKWDADIRDGWSPSGRTPHFPLVLGTDGAGLVAAHGARVRHVAVGDRVYSYSWDNKKGGFYAEYVAVPAERVAPARAPIGPARNWTSPIPACVPMRSKACGKWTLARSFPSCSRRP